MCRAVELGGLPCPLRCVSGSSGVPHAAACIPPAPGKPSLRNVRDEVWWGRMSREEKVQVLLGGRQSCTGGRQPAALQTAVNTTAGSGAACESLHLGSGIAHARVTTSSSACFQCRTLPPSPKGKRTCQPGGSRVAPMALPSGEGAETGGSCVEE